MDSEAELTFLEGEVPKEQDINLPWGGIYVKNIAPSLAGGAVGEKSRLNLLDLPPTPPPGSGSKEGGISPTI